MRVIPNVVLVAALTAVPDIACAQEASGGTNPSGVRWAAPEGCPSATTLLQRIEAIVGSPLRDKPPLDASVVVVGQSRTWRADVKLPGEGAARSVEGESCDAVADAVALILAVSIDPDANRQRAPAPAPPSPTAPAIEGRSPSRSRSGFFAGASFVVATGTLPSLALGPAVIAGGRLGSVQLGVEAGASAKVSASTAERPTQGASFWVAHATARGCYFVSVLPSSAQGAGLEAGPCLGMLVERTAASGFGSLRPAEADAVVAAPVAGAVVLVHLFRQLAVRAALEASAPLARPRFVIEGTGLVHRPSTFGARAALGVEMSF